MPLIASECPLLVCAARQVVWDDETPPWGKGFPPPPSVPFVDLNDPNVILECDLVDEVAARSARSAASARATLAQDDARGASAVPSATGGRARDGAGRQAGARAEAQRRVLVGARDGAEAEEEEEEAEVVGAQDGADVTPAGATAGASASTADTAPKTAPQSAADGDEEDPNDPHYRNDPNYRPPDEDDDEDDEAHARPRRRARARVGGVGGVVVGGGGKRRKAGAGGAAAAGAEHHGAETVAPETARSIGTSAADAAPPAHRSTQRPLAARLVDDRAFDLSEAARPSSCRFDEHKLCNPQLTHLACARRLEHPPLEFDETELLSRHRPRKLLGPVPRTVVQRGLPEGGGAGSSVVSGGAAGAPGAAARALWRQDSSDLSVAEGPGTGRLLLAEYLEEHPLLLNRPGMASKFVSYARRRAGERPPPPPTLGERVWIENEEDADSKLPFVLGAALPPSGELTAMKTNLTCAPVAEHLVPSNTFVLIVRRSTAADGSVQTHITLRQVSLAHCLCWPLMATDCPQSPSVQVSLAHCL